MARQPGTASWSGLLLTLTEVCFGLTVLVGGHLILFFQFWFWLQERSGVGVIAEKTSLPVWLLWLCVVAALFMDIWILNNKRQQKKALQKR